MIGRKLTSRQIAIIKQLEDYAYNAMEICRVFNGIAPRSFKGCYFKFGINRRGPRCRHNERGCQVKSGSIDATLRAMQKRGLVRSIKMRWFDGRDKGAWKNSLQLDIFRFYYTTKAGLANRLEHDIKTHLRSD